MNKRCSVCTHPALPEIDRALMSGMPLRSLAARYSLSPSALSRHTKHLKRQRALHKHQARQAQQQAILEHLELLSARLDRLYHTAADLRSLNVALGCLRESVRLLSLHERFRHSL